MEDQTCANRSKDRWRVFAEDGGVAIERTTAEDKLPGWTVRFVPQVGMAFAGGALIAANPTEQGAGGLWWLNTATGESRILLDENVVHLRYDSDGSVLAFSQHEEWDGTEVFRVRATQERVDIVAVGPLEENDQVVVDDHGYLSPPRVLRFSDGFLLALDHGEEMGGGLWWAAADGVRQRRLLPGNVSHLEMMPDGSVLAFTTNVSGDSGEVFALRAAEEEIAVERLGQLGSMVSVVGPSQGGFVVVAHKGVWALPTGKEPRLLAEADTTFLIPNSVVMLDDGSIYVGMNALVLRLSRTEGQYKREWLLPGACAGLVLRGRECECRE